jgi:pimeloyl-ACP methyl ester carboxylesterase
MRGAPILPNQCIIEEVVETSSGPLYMKRSNPLNKSSRIPIVFLHGFSFTSDVWSEIGVFEALCGKAIPFVAPDMPYGMKVKRSFKSRDPDKNVNTLAEALGSVGVNSAYLVGASLGGYIALRYTITKGGATGLTLIAPVNSLEENIIEYFRSNPVPVQVIYGSNDNIVSKKELEEFTSLVGGDLLVYEDAPHPAYLKYPDRFIDDLLNHYNRVVSKEI